MSLVEKKAILDEFRMRFDENQGALPNEEIRSYLRLSQDVERVMMIGLDLDRKGMRRRLKKIQRESERNLNPARIAAEYTLFGTAEFFQKKALMELTLRRIPGFIFWADLAHGSMMMASTLGGAANGALISKSGEVYAIAMEEYKQLHGDPPVPEDEAAMMYSMGTTPYFRRFESLMAEDPSGFSLADDFLGILREEFQKDPESRSPSVLIPHFQMTDFVLRGAEIGVRVYKRVYPVAKTI